MLVSLQSFTGFGSPFVCIKQSHGQELVAQIDIYAHTVYIIYCHVYM